MQAQPQLVLVPDQLLGQDHVRRILQVADDAVDNLLAEHLVLQRVRLFHDLIDLGLDDRLGPVGCARESQGDQAKRAMSLQSQYGVAVTL